MAESRSETCAVFAFIAASAWLRLEITKALRRRPKSMVIVVMMASRIVTGSMSRGTREVTMPAPLLTGGVVEIAAAHSGPGRGVNVGSI